MYICQGYRININYILLCFLQTDKLTNLYVYPISFRYQLKCSVIRSTTNIQKTWTTLFAYQVWHNSFFHCPLRTFLSISVLVNVSTILLLATHCMNKIYKLCLEISSWMKHKQYNMYTVYSEILLGVVYFNPRNTPMRFFRKKWCKSCISF